MWLSVGVICRCSALFSDRKPHVLGSASGAPNVVLPCSRSPTIRQRTLAYATSNSSWTNTGSVGWRTRVRGRLGASGRRSRANLPRASRSSRIGKQKCRARRRVMALSSRWWCRGGTGRSCRWPLRARDSALGVRAGYRKASRAPNTRPTASCLYTRFRKRASVWPSTCRLSGCGRGPGKPWARGISSQGTGVKPKSPLREHEGQEVLAG